MIHRIITILLTIALVIMAISNAKFREQFMQFNQVVRWLLLILSGAFALFLIIRALMLNLK